MLPTGFVYLNKIDPTIMVDLKYASTDNFLGAIVDGYKANVAICTNAAADALSIAQAEAKVLGYSLKIFDAYRPVRAVEHFWRWANDPIDTKTKADYYPSFQNKVDLFDGYIARHSQHSRGSAVDLTLVSLIDNKEVDMGTHFDFLDDASHTTYPNCSKAVQSNRALLKMLMESHGFQNYRKEWWHYSLINEPFTRIPQDHFDFEVNSF